MNHGNAVVGIRLMILRDYLQANAGPNKAVKREELEQYLEDCEIDLWDMYDAYIKGEKEIAEINAEFQTNYYAE